MSFKSAVHSIAVSVAEKTMPDEIKPPPPPPPPLSASETKILIQVKANLSEVSKKVALLETFLRSTVDLLAPHKKRVDGFDLSDSFYNLKSIKNDLKQHIALLERSLKS